MTKDERFALEMARFYRAKHINVIPSSTTEKKPLYSFADRYGWDAMFPAEWFTDEAWEERPTTNLQVVTGASWRLLAVDLDGPKAKAVWDRWVAERGCRRTWIVHREDGDSYHWWFKVPRWWDGPVKKRVVWQEEGAKHSAIEVLGDRSLITAPPSKHVKTGGLYRFLEGHTPFSRGLGHPAEAPSWVMNLPSVMKEKPVFVRPKPKNPLPVLDREGLPSRDEILDLVHDKAAFARVHWGLRVTGRVSPTGWAECHALDRPDEQPSAAIHKETGVYTDRGTGVAMSLFDIPISLGIVHDFPESCALIYKLAR